METSNRDTVYYFLGRCRPFAHLPERAMSALASVSRLTDEVPYPETREVVRPDSPVHDLFVLVSGELEVRVDNRPVGHTEEFGLVGDHEILTGERFGRASVVVVSQQVRLIRIPDDRLYAVADRYPLVWVQLVRELAARLKRVEEATERERHLLDRIDSSVDQLDEWKRVLRAALTERESAVSHTSERRFLACLDAPWMGNVAPEPLQQGYIALDERNEIRVRFDGQSHSLTGKRKQEGRRAEITLEAIGAGLFGALWMFVAERIVTKDRYRFPVAGGEWRIDVFSRESKLAGLVIAEFDGPDLQQVPEPPMGVTLVRELIGEENERYRNQALAMRGLPAEKDRDN